MANSLFKLIVAIFSLLVITLSPTYGFPLYPHYYTKSCPRVEQIVYSVVANAVAKDPRMAASLIRLHFHDCFVKGCDASVLLDSSGTIVSEKRANPNRNSARGFEVIDEIKDAVEQECPWTVSCADILTLAARDSITHVGGPWWEVPLGRKDSFDASFSGANSDIPAPNNTFHTILNKYKVKGLNTVDLVALSGCHTIGDARCTSFRQRLYNQNRNGHPDYTLNPNYADWLRDRCPRSGGDQNLFNLDYATPFKFDNSYYKNILAYNALLSSDQILLTRNARSAKLVKLYAENNEIFFQHFAQSMIKMGNISPKTGLNGEIRKNCRRVNHYY